MSEDRRLRIRRELFDQLDGDLTSARLGELSMSVTGASGAGIMLMSGDLRVGAACTSGEVSMLIEDLQYTLGEGPCLDAYNLKSPVQEPDLADPVEPRWLAFTPQAVDAGVRAVFGFPVGIGSVRMGALDLYNDQPGPLSDDQHADALVIADVAAEALLAMQAGQTAGVLSARLEHGSNFHYVAHQAAGMVSTQLGVSIAQALVRLRAYAFAHERLLPEVAADVVAGRLRFDDQDS